MDRRTVRINPRTRAYGLEGSWPRAPHSCCRQRTPLILVLYQNPLLPAAKAKKKKKIKQKGRGQPVITIRDPE